MLRCLLAVGLCLAPASAWGQEGSAERATGLARAELASFQTLSGVGLTAELCVIAECSDARVWAVLLSLGGAGGLVGSLWATTDGIRPGQALVINNGTIWGIVNGAGLAAVAESSERSAGALVFGGHVLGLGAGALISRYLEPRSGDVAFASSIGLWTAAFATFAHGATEFDADGPVIAGTILAAGDVGLAAGIALAAAFRRWAARRGQPRRLTVMRISPPITSTSPSCSACVRTIRSFT